MSDPSKNPAKNGVRNLASKKLAVVSAVVGILLGIPNPGSSDLFESCRVLAIGFSVGVYLLGQGVADGRSA